MLIAEECFVTVMQTTNYVSVWYTIMCADRERTETQMDAERTTPRRLPEMRRQTTSARLEFEQLAQGDGRVHRQLKTRGREDSIDPMEDTSSS